MSKARTSDNALAEVENAARELGFDYPIAWALGWLVDHQKMVSPCLEKEAKKNLQRLCREIRQGN